MTEDEYMALTTYNTIVHAQSILNDGMIPVEGCITEEEINTVKRILYGAMIRFHNNRPYEVIERDENDE